MILTTVNNAHLRMVSSIEVSDIDPLLRHEGTQIAALSAPFNDPPRPISAGESCSVEFPMFALGEVGTSSAAAFRRLTQAPGAICAQSVIGAMSAVSALCCDIATIYGDTMPMAVFLATVALSGERKSTTDKQATKGIIAYERGLRERFKQNQQENIKNSSYISSSKNNSARIAISAEPSAEIMASDPTIEGLFDLIVRGPGTAYLANDDAGGFFGGYAMSAEQRLKTIAALASLFSGTAIKRPRAHGQNEIVEGVPLTAHLMFQPYLLPQIYGDRQLLEQGILPRILPAFPDSTIGTRLFNKPTNGDLQTARAFALRCLELLQRFGNAKANANKSEADRLSSGRPLLLLSNVAQDHLIAFYNEVEIKSSEKGEYSSVCSFASRAAENATRLAGLLTIFDDPDAEEVGGVAALNGIELMRFYLASFQHIVKVAQTKRQESDAASLGRWLYGDVGAGGRTHDKRISQFGPSKFRDQAQRRAALDILIAHGWIRALPPGTVVQEGRRELAFELHPEIATVAT